LNKHSTTEETDEHLSAEEVPLDNESDTTGVYPPRLESLRHKLNRKAILVPNFRFYSLYGHIMDMMTLEESYKRVRKNKGAPGVDGVSFYDIEQSEGGVAKFLLDIQSELKAKTYEPNHVKRVYIPKANGKLRPLGIPTIKDRVVQMATLLIIEPIFEADFHDCSHGFRPNKSAHEALKKIHAYLKDGYEAVYDADLQGYFDSIPHDKLMEQIKRRITDRGVLNLISMWLKSPVREETKGEPPKVSRSDKGTPQGGVISPLLANIYLHDFDSHFHSVKGAAAWAKAKLVRYADDFVVLARHISNALKGYIRNALEVKLGLVINQEKTKIVDMKQRGSKLKFLGNEFVVRENKFDTTKNYTAIKASEDAIRKEKEKISEMTNKKNCYKQLSTVIKELNRQMRGWCEYFRLGYPSDTFSKINFHTSRRLIQFVKRKSQKGHRLPKTKTYYEYFEDLGLKQMLVKDFRRA
jgi:RNA-directed DNA polymerase